MNKFTAGATYSARFINDSASRIQLTVIKRTVKTITCNVEGEGMKTLRINQTEEGEFVFPLGRYSMAPRVRAA